MSDYQSVVMRLEGAKIPSPRISRVLPASSLIATFPPSQTGRGPTSCTVSSQKVIRSMLVTRLKETSVIDRQAGPRQIASFCIIVRKS